MPSASLNDIARLLDDTVRHPPGAEFLTNMPPLVLFGAGGRGRRILATLRRAGLSPVAFCDNQTSLHGTLIDNLPVLPPGKAATVEAVCQQLASLGITRVASFTALYERLPDLFFPDFFMDRLSITRTEKTAILQTASLWQDDRSAREYLAQLRLRLELDFRHVDRAGCDHPAYFPPDLFTLTENESFVDCGAFDGDTYADFIRVTDSHFQRYIALEPDVDNFAKLAVRTAAETSLPAPRVRLLRMGVSERACVIRFSADSSTESRISDEGTQEIQCLSLDEILQGESPTFIKMDIEGAEGDALCGAATTLANHRPILAVSAYHRATDLWRLPALIASLVTDYSFFLRPEKKAGWDLICYAIPRERLLSHHGTAS
jgi:FkbM family methyltransferase